ncbi:TPA: hypothetical protein NO555_001810 [Klebsiella variicola subsp. variicola]|nr:hypothetical protein [Klebsiella variicola subsp. variicola]HCI4623557.1 hypothetical protein [Klebsiella variicola subsp. variicola]HCI6657769.1 hypothetical protein [Klebsiella variicola subsp. variicola]
MKRLVFILISCSLFGAKAEDLKTLSTTSKKIDSSTAENCLASKEPCKPHKITQGITWQTKREEYKLNIKSKTESGDSSITKESKKTLIQTQRDK